jgi:hypothetical protein
VDRETEEPESNLCLAIFQVDDVRFGSEIHQCTWYQGIPGLSQSASPAQKVAQSASCRTFDFEPEVQGLLISCDSALDRLCLRDPEAIPRKVDSHRAGTNFYVEDYPGSATVLDQMSIGGSRIRHGDEEVDTIFEVSQGSVSLDGINALGMANRESASG